MQKKTKKQLEIKNTCKQRKTHNIHAEKRENQAYVENGSNKMEIKLEEVKIITSLMRWFKWMGKRSSRS